jgi:hypothetical protein
VVENKIMSSRLVLRVMDKVSSELDDLRLRMQLPGKHRRSDRLMTSCAQKCWCWCWWSNG